ncbi:unnamed protein product [Miscanthus lutarioriparius]|uniref:Uncharacterized protein n=1 Tax=Miscanthus lutarioriparius TaxID=422564 RepID=A0A811Q9P9_9POAL|nr:unnamed protein product [Miscanthus lutarioriparius]
MGMTPLLVSMPYLVEAFIRLGYCNDFCKHSYEIGDCRDESCWGCQFYEDNYGKNNCILLHGLSSCTNLELTAATAPFIFRKDLTRCPVFSKLKTLLLNEWCITNNLGALICFLQRSPVQEKLIIQFEPPEIHERLVEIGASYDLRKQSLVLKDLNVEVRCDDGNERVHKVLDVLGSYGLSPEKFKIQRPPKLTRARFDDTWTSGITASLCEAQGGPDCLGDTFRNCFYAEDKYIQIKSPSSGAATLSKTIKIARASG